MQNTRSIPNSVPTGGQPTIRDRIRSLLVNLSDIHGKLSEAKAAIFGNEPSNADPAGKTGPVTVDGMLADAHAITDDIGRVVERLCSAI